MRKVLFTFAFLILLPLSIKAQANEVYLELYKRINTGSILSIRSNTKIANFKNLEKSLIINTHGKSIYMVDIKDGLLLFHKNLKGALTKRLWKTFTDAIGFVIVPGENTESDETFITTVNGEIFYGNRWSKKVGASIFSAPSAYDVNDDGKLELLFGDDNGNIHIFKTDGSEILKVSQIRGMVTSPPVFIKDTKGEGLIFAGASDGKLYAITLKGKIKWKLQTPYEIYSAPVAGDIDGDGEKEIVFSNIGGEVYSVELNGKGMKKILFAKFWIEANPALGDLDGDGKPEIITGSWDNHIYVVNGGGKILWKYDTGSDIRTTPLIADINGDDKQEIIVATDSGKILIFSQAGELLNEKRVSTTSLCQPSVIEYGDENRWSVVVGSENRKIYIYKTSSKGNADWPLYRHDNLNTGIYK